MSELLQYELTLPIAPDAELVAASTIEKIALLSGFDEKAMSEVRLAVIEACINAFEHSHSPDRRVYLTFMSEKDRLVVTVRDFGRGFKPTAAEPACIPPKLSKLRPRGWGLVLIRRFMDEVEILEISPGTELRMTKFLDRSSPASTAVARNQSASPPAAT
jgi:serine/threonine-protein kinase RsbW